MAKLTRLMAGTSIIDRTYAHKPGFSTNPWFLKERLTQKPGFWPHKETGFLCKSLVSQGEINSETRFLASACVSPDRIECKSYRSFLPVSYCINPQCLTPSNPDDFHHCQSCGSSLLINARYRVVRPLRAMNSASFSDIFEVKDLSFEVGHWGTAKVLKVLKSSANPELIRLFQEAARALIWLRHPGIPKVEPDGYFRFSPAGISQYLHCLVMEKIAGINLNIWLEDNRILSQDLALNWLEQLTKILAVLHQYEIVHRDIKPSNLILTPNGKLVLIDFGSVAITGSDQTKVGTIGYAPPGQMEGKAVWQSDFFALGRTFVHLFTRTHPMLLPTDAKTGQLIWRNLAPQVSDFLADRIDQLMA